MAYRLFSKINPVVRGRKPDEYVASRMSRQEHRRPRFTILRPRRMDMVHRFCCVALPGCDGGLLVFARRPTDW